MMQGGTLDLGITPFLNPLYDKLQSPRYHLVLKNETHFGWTNLIALGQTTTAAIEKGNCRWITAYTVAFFQQHLRGKDQPLLKEDNAELFRYRQAER
jgi:hypothetical protein